MAKHGRTHDEDGRRGDRFRRDELDELEGEVLPQRAATSLINPHLGMPLTAALGAHAASGDAAAADPDPVEVDEADPE
jgi:hypothetical protein